MGQEIVYCHGCQSRLIGSEFEKGKAFRIQNQNYCLSCAQKLLQSLPPQERDAFAAHMTAAKDKGKSTQRIAVVRQSESQSRIPTLRPPTPRPDSTHTRLAAMQGGPRRTSPLLWIGLAGAGLAAVLLLAVALSGDPAPAPPTAVAPPLPATSDPRAEEARRLLESAKAYAATNPSDTVGQIDRYSKAAWHAPGTPAAAEALTKVEEVRARSRARQETELAELDRQVTVLAAKKDFAGARSLLEAARSRRTDNDWGLALKRRIEQVAALEGGTKPFVQPSAPPVPVYRDGLEAPWLNRSWDSDVEFAHASERFEGTSSLAWTPRKHAAGLYLVPSHDLPLDGLRALSFALLVREADAPVTVALWTDESRDNPIPLSDLGLPRVGAWKIFEVPVARFKPRGRLLKGLVFQAFRHNNETPVALIDAIVLLRGETPPAAAGADDFSPLTVVEARSSAGSELRVQGDGAVAVSGPRPERDAYVLRLKSSLKEIRAIRLEALPDPSLPAGGPGRSDNGNFVLTEMRIEAGGRPVELLDAAAGFAQEHFPAHEAFDGNPAGGWAVMPRLGEPHRLVVRLKEPVDGADLAVTLDFSSPYADHSLGRFRLSATAVRPPDPPPGTPALPDARTLAGRRRWFAAAVLAAARDYPAAIRELEGAAASELDDLRLAAKAHAEALDILAKWPPGWNLVAELAAEDGRRRRVDEPVRRVSGTRVEVRGAGFEAGAMSAASLADLLLARRSTPADVRAAGLFCAFDGDVEAARKHLGGLSFEFESHARSLPPPEHAEEADARRRLLEAETAWADPAARAAAMDNIASLLKDRGRTLLVRRCAAGLRARLEAPPDVFFAPGELASSGVFAPQRHPKGELAWTMLQDVAREERAEHHVEAAYSVRPGTEVRAWVLAGGCCAETFTFAVSATDLPPASAEEPATAVVPAIPFLKKTHASHGGGPKAPSRFDWIALPSIRHAQGGTKRLKIESDQEGFSVAAVLVSASRTKPPSDAELRDLLAHRPLPEAESAGRTGSVLREIWEKASGYTIPDLAKVLMTPPTRTERVKSFQGERDWGNDYGTRMRGWIHPPQTGAYVFYLTTDDHGELWLSPDENPGRKERIAQQDEAGGYDDWKKTTTAPVALQKGRRYYIEALHKEGGGDDHVRVGWKLPDGTLERPIPGRSLSPFDPLLVRPGPVLDVAAAAYPAGAPIPMTVDLNGLAVSRAEIWQGNTRLGEARGTPPAFTWSSAPAGVHALWARLVERSGRAHTTPVAAVTVGDVWLARAVDLNGPGGRLDGRAWLDGGAAVVVGQGYERLDLELRPSPRADRARMIRSSVAAREAVVGGLAPGKYLVYLTLWEPEERPSTFDLLVNGKAVATSHRFAAQGDWTRMGPWPAETADGRITVSAARGTAHFSGLEVWGLGAPPAPSVPTKSPLIGGSSGSAFEVVGGNRPLLVGFRVTDKNDKLSSITPLFTTGPGSIHGKPDSNVKEFLAKDGYAVGGLYLRSDGRVVDAFRVVFLRIKGDRLDPDDRYESTWYAVKSPITDAVLVGGDGNPVVGIHGRSGELIDALGIIQLK